MWDLNHDAKTYLGTRKRLTVINRLRATKEGRGVVGEENQLGI